MFDSLWCQFGWTNLASSKKKMIIPRLCCRWIVPSTMIVFSSNCSITYRMSTNNIVEHGCVLTDIWFSFIVNSVLITFNIKLTSIDSGRAINLSLRSLDCITTSMGCWILITCGWHGTIIFAFASCHASFAPCHTFK
jgi:hypothetical protein